MSGVRPFAPDDLEQVAALYESVWRSGTRTPAPGLAAYFQRVFLDGPGLAPGMQSLVYEAQGKVLGFIGVQVRQVRFEGVPSSLVCTGPLFTEPDAKVAAALLTKGAMEGPQLLTITDGATPDALRLWVRMRGYVNAIEAIRWTRIFRPWRLVSGHLARRRGVGPFWRPFDRLGRPLLAAADGATRAVTGSRPSPPSRPLRAEDLTAEGLVQGQDALSTHYRLHPDYDPATCSWLFREMRYADDRGPLRARLLRDADGRIAGWYVYYAPKGGIARVVQVAALPREHGAVLEHLVADADAQGVAALQGRIEPNLVEPLRDMGVKLHYDASMSLIHSREPRVYAAVLGGEAILSRLEGEWYFSFQNRTLRETPR